MWVVGLPMIAAIAIFAVGCAIAAREVVRIWPSLDWRHRLHMSICFVCITLFILGLLNFMAFWMISLAIGGDADTVENGRFFVASRGRFTEVSELTWNYSYYHTRSLWISHPVAVLSIAMAFLSGKLLGIHEQTPPQNQTQP